MIFVALVWKQKRNKSEQKKIRKTFDKGKKALKEDLCMHLVLGKVQREDSGGTCRSDTLISIEWVHAQNKFGWNSIAASLKKTVSMTLPMEKNLGLKAVNVLLPSIKRFQLFYSCHFLYLPAKLSKVRLGKALQFAQEAMSIHYITWNSFFFGHFSEPCIWIYPTRNSPFQEDWSNWPHPE